MGWLIYGNARIKHKIVRRIDGRTHAILAQGHTQQQPGIPGGDNVWGQTEKEKEKEPNGENTENVNVMWEIANSRGSKKCNKRCVVVKARAHMPVFMLKF